MLDVSLIEVISEIENQRRGRTICQRNSLLVSWLYCKCILYAHSMTIICIQFKNPEVDVLSKCEAWGVTFFLQWLSWIRLTTGCMLLKVLKGVHLDIFVSDKVARWLKLMWLIQYFKAKKASAISLVRLVCPSIQSSHADPRPGAWRPASFCFDSLKTSWSTWSPLSTSAWDVLRVDRSKLNQWKGGLV